MLLLVPTLLTRLGAVTLQGVVILAITVGLLEALVVLSFQYPGVSPIPLAPLRQMHVLFDRNTIQVMPECAVYDDTLTYTLRPGGCTFANREFSNTYAINTLGVRDDDASLDQPRVVVLGDSLAMGWGVEQDESFPSVFERLTGLRTLNAGVSSYGTVRELRMLQRVDRRKLTHVVIQYSGNDLLENEQLVAGRFKNLSRDDYERTVRAQADLLQYHPGKHALNLLVMLRNLILERGSLVAPPSRTHEAEVFLQVMAQSPVDLAGYDITVLSLESAFVEAVRPLAAVSPLPMIRRLRFLDLGDIASIPDAFYVLDEHPTRVGQEAIGRVLASAIVRQP